MSLQLTKRETERITAYIKVEESGCWRWRGTIMQEYAYIWLRRKYERVHRVMYMACRGEIPRPLVIDHLCRVKDCVNPYHLEVVTIRENTVRGIGPSAQNAAKVYCKRGHLLDGENMRTNSDGQRICRVCQKEQAQRRFALFTELHGGWSPHWQAKKDPACAGCREFLGGTYA